MAAERIHHVARERNNTLDLGIRGYVWAQFVSPLGYVIGGFPGKLSAEGREWEEQKISRDGECCWDLVPLLDFEVELQLAGRHLHVPVPWLQTLDQIHMQRLMDAGQILGSEDCPYGIQVRLNGLGFNCGAVDGVIGPKTSAATLKFQTDRGLFQDGDPGPATQGYLIEAFGA